MFSIWVALVASLLGYASMAWANSCSNVDVIGTFDESGVVKMSIRYMRLDHFELRVSGMKASSLCLTSLRLIVKSDAAMRWIG
jgi:hypothetical protein